LYYASTGILMVELRILYESSVNDEGEAMVGHSVMEQTD
jgi:hypothetical protein